MKTSASAATAVPGFAATLAFSPSIPAALIFAGSADFPIFASQAKMRAETSSAVPSPRSCA